MGKFLLWVTHYIGFQRLLAEALLFHSRIYNTRCIILIWALWRTQYAKFRTQHLLNLVYPIVYGTRHLILCSHAAVSVFRCYSRKTEISNRHTESADGEGATGIEETPLSQHSILLNTASFWIAINVAVSGAVLTLEPLQPTTSYHISLNDAPRHHLPCCSCLNRIWSCSSNWSPGKDSSRVGRWCERHSCWDQTGRGSPEAAHDHGRVLKLVRWLVTLFLTLLIITQYILCGCVVFVCKRHHCFSHSWILPFSGCGDGGFHGAGGSGYHGRDD